MNIPFPDREDIPCNSTMQHFSMPLYKEVQNVGLNTVDHIRFSVVSVFQKASSPSSRNDGVYVQVLRAQAFIAGYEIEEVVGERDVDALVKDVYMQMQEVIAPGITFEEEKVGGRAVAA